MKNLLSLALLLITCTAFAQTKIKEGKVTYELSYGEITEEMKKMESMLPKSMDIYFKGDKARTEMSMATGKMIIIMDMAKKEMMLLMDMMGQKMAMKQTEEDLKKKEEELKTKGLYDSIEVTTTKETKKINGYNCKKVIISYVTAGVRETSVCYVTDELPTINTTQDNPIYSKIKGFMMEYTMKQQGIVVTIKATKVTALKVDDSMFITPEGYQLIDPSTLGGGPVSDH